MINNAEFTKRLQKVMEYYNESASSFAGKIGAQRSSISHILSGRNKPSLDFVLKVLSYFPEVDLYWLLNGKGEFPKTEKIVIEEPKISKETKTETQIDIPETSNLENTNSKKTIERIIIFYSDGSFENFKN